MAENPPVNWGQYSDVVDTRMPPAPQSAPHGTPRWVVSVGALGALGTGRSAQAPRGLPRHADSDASHADPS